jgi:hypothetical protein
VRLLIVSWMKHEGEYLREVKYLLCTIPRVILRSDVSRVLNDYSVQQNSFYSRLLMIPGHSLHPLLSSIAVNFGITYFCFELIFIMRSWFTGCLRGVE